MGRSTGQRRRDLGHARHSRCRRFRDRLNGGAGHHARRTRHAHFRGERQRLCLARAVLRRPFLFVLDEATSAIDVPAERKIIKAILDLKPRPTIVMIAHRDQSLAFCDRMLRLQNGKAITDEPALTG